jgi:ABC-type cobalamin/Fe3+-siderophores transport system ATPase subunit
MNEQKQNDFLKQVRIEGLWNRLDINWDLHPDVNILVGENGTGKSTVLQLMAKLGIPSFSMTKTTIFKIIKLDFESGNQIFASKDFRQLERNNHQLHVQFVNTVEFITDSGAAEGVSNLDKELEQVTRQYLAYQSKQSQRVFAKKLDFEQAFERKTYLISTLNELFAPTEKKVDEEEAELGFVLPDGSKIHRKDLSSGEKQLLILMLTVLCQDDQPSLLLLDEPELSLHLKWQYRLIEILRNLNPNCQFVIATHSPSIFNDGWRDKVFWMEDLVKKVELVY